MDLRGSPQEAPAIMAQPTACIFCQIAQGQPLKGQATPTPLLYADEEFVAFADHRPAGKHHYLIIPRQHIRSVTDLAASDAAMVERLDQIGRQLLIDRGGDPERALVGFHWPLYTVGHLHLHVISPPDEMNLWQRLEFSRYSFGSVNQALERLASRNK